MKRVEERKKLNALRLTAEQLEPYVMSLDEMRKWGYIVDIPAGEGGSRPSEEGSVKTCERCSGAFKVKRKEEASMDECVYHWGKAFSAKASGTSIFTHVRSDYCNRSGSAADWVC